MLDRETSLPDPSLAMNLSLHETPAGPRWAGDGSFLAETFSLDAFLSRNLEEGRRYLNASTDGWKAEGRHLAPVEAMTEIWACGVTYLRSRDAREAESSTADIYQRVSEAPRPEIFFKSIGWRVRGTGSDLRLRADSHWNVPEPELTLILNAHAEIVGYTAGNDLSSRSIEGENPLYLPQAKCFDGCCALGPYIILAGEQEIRKIPIELQIHRKGVQVFSGETSTEAMKRSWSELAGYLFKEMSFPNGVALMTGTGIVPEEGFSLRAGDRISIRVGEVRLVNSIS